MQFRIDLIRHSAEHLVLVVALATLLLTSCQSSSPPVSGIQPGGATGARSAPREENKKGTGLAKVETNPLFWRVDGGVGATLFVLGSIHFGPAQGWAYPEAIETAFGRATGLVVEVDDRTLDGDARLALVARHALIPPPQSIEDVISADAMESLLNYLEGSSLDAEAIMQLRPWMVSTLIVIDSIESQGQSGRNGVDRSFLDRAEDRKVLALETVESQMALLSDASPQLQEILLLDAIEQVQKGTTESARMMKAWRLGDGGEIEAILAESAKRHPQFEDFNKRLLGDRNEKMVGRLVRLLNDPKLAGRTVFVVIGAGHMVGQGSIPDLFEQRGFNITQLRAQPNQPERSPHHAD